MLGYWPMSYLARATSFGLPQCDLNALSLPRHGSLPTPGFNPAYCRRSLHLRARVGVSICSASDLHIPKAMTSICSHTSVPAGPPPQLRTQPRPQGDSKHWRLHYPGEVVLMTCCQVTEVSYARTREKDALSSHYRRLVNIT
jgi:hypothetical protein